MSSLWVQAASHNKDVLCGYSQNDTQPSRKIAENLSKAQEILLRAGHKVNDALGESSKWGSFPNSDDDEDARKVVSWAETLEGHPELNNLLQRHINIANNTEDLEPHEAICRECAIGDSDGPHDRLWQGHWKDPHLNGIEHPDTGKRVHCACWCNEK